jgi:hypothetical protein
MTCCWCRWSHPATMAIRTCRIMGCLGLKIVPCVCTPVYCQSEIFQQGSVSRVFQPYNSRPYQILESIVMEKKDCNFQT